jgi:hypothetical protein
MAVNSTAFSTQIIADDAVTTVKIQNGAVTVAKCAAGVIAPVGSVFSWLKTLTNTPALPANWVECNGQVLSDADSVYDGVTLPNLNGASAQPQRFLRGAATSGTTGGEDAHTLSAAEMPTHSHLYSGGTGGASGSADGTTGNLNKSTTDAGSGNAHENRPSFYEVVFIMRIK